MRPEAYETKLEQTAQDTIEKWMRDGLSLERAVDKWQSICHTVLPDHIKDLIKEN